jgi:hypothetical protein
VERIDHFKLMALGGEFAFRHEWRIPPIFDFQIIASQFANRASAMRLSKSAHGHSASVDFKPALALGAENQNAFIETVRALNAMTPRFGKPAETDDMQADTEGMATHIPKHANRREMHNPVWVSLRPRFHVW